MWRKLSSLPWQCKENVVATKVISTVARAIGYLVFWAKSTTSDHIRAERDFHKILYSWKDQQGRDKTGRTESENGEFSEEFMEQNTLEKAKKTETDTRKEWKGAGKLGWFMSNTNRNIPTTWRWARGDWPEQEKEKSE